MARQDRQVLEDAVRAISKAAADSSSVVDEAADALQPDDPLTVHAKMLRQELLEVKAGIEWELSKLVLDCTACGQRVHYVGGLGVSAGHWAHGEPSPHHEPVLNAQG